MRIFSELLEEQRNEISLIFRKENKNKMVRLLDKIQETKSITSFEKNWKYQYK